MLLEKYSVLSQTSFVNTFYEIYTEGSLQIKGYFFTM